MLINYLYRYNLTVETDRTSKLFARYQQEKRDNKIGKIPM